MYVINTQDAYFGDLTFYGNQRLITGQKIYSVNDDIVEMSKNGLIVDIYTN